MFKNQQKSVQVYGKHFLAACTTGVLATRVPLHHRDSNSGSLDDAVKLFASLAGPIVFINKNNSELHRYIPGMVNV